MPLYRIDKVGQKYRVQRKFLRYFWCTILVCSTREAAERAVQDRHL